MSSWKIPKTAAGFIGQRQAGEILINILRDAHFPDDCMFPEISHGAKCLAAWIMRNQSRVQRLAASVIDGDTLSRILIGEVIPGEEDRQRIAELTIGAVMPDMFDSFPEAVAVVPDRPSVPDRTSVPAFQLSPLGHTPDRGPLVQIEGNPEGFFVRLPGMVLALDRGTAAGLHQALGKVVEVAA